MKTPKEFAGEIVDFVEAYDCPIKEIELRISARDAEIRAESDYRHIPKGPTP